MCLHISLFMQDSRWVTLISLLGAAVFWNTWGLILIGDYLEGIHVYITRLRSEIVLFNAPELLVTYSLAFPVNSYTSQ